MDRPGEWSSSEASWDTLRTRLEQERGRIQQEIRSYPTPIAGCDQQFNALLQERSRIAAELRRLEEALAEGARSGAPGPALDAFLRSCRYLKG